VRFRCACLPRTPHCVTVNSSRLYEHTRHNRVGQHTHTQTHTRTGWTLAHSRVYLIQSAPMKTHAKPNLLGNLSIERCRNWNLNKKCQNRDILFKGFISRVDLFKKKIFFSFFMPRYINSYVALHNYICFAPQFYVFMSSRANYIFVIPREFRGTPHTWVSRLHFARRLGREFAFTRRGIPRFLEVVKRECIIPQLATGKR